MANAQLDVYETKKYQLLGGLAVLLVSMLKAFSSLNAQSQSEQSDFWTLTTKGNRELKKRVAS
jgi:hypothetical protein